MTLEHLALRWLRLDKACVAAMHERSPRPLAGQPDVLGVTKAGYLIEVEIKRSMSDFRANAEKRHIRARHVGQPGDKPWLARYPRQYWFLVDSKLEEKAKSELPEWAGLLIGRDYYISEAVKAPVNTAATRLNAKEYLSLGRLMANQILSLSTQMEVFRLKDDYTPWTWDQYAI